MVRGSTRQYYYGGAVTGMTTLGAATIIQGPGRQPLEHGWGDRQKPALPATRIPPKTCHKDDIVGSTGPSFCVPLINFVCFSCLYAVECDIFFVSNGFFVYFGNAPIHPGRRLMKATSCCTSHARSYPRAQITLPRYLFPCPLLSAKPNVAQGLLKYTILLCSWIVGLILFISSLNAPKNRPGQRKYH